MEKQSWRKAILEQLADDEDVDIDALHEDVDGDEDALMEAVQDLEQEGLTWDDHGMIKPRAGAEDKIRAALAAC